MKSDSDFGMSSTDAVIFNMIVKDVLTGKTDREDIFKFAKSLGWDRTKFNFAYEQVEKFSAERISEMSKEVKKPRELGTLTMGLIITLLILSIVIFVWGEGVFFGEIPLINQILTSVALSMGFGMGFIALWVICYTVIKNLSRGG